MPKLEGEKSESNEVKQDSQKHLEKTLTSKEAVIVVSMGVLGALAGMGYKWAKSDKPEIESLLLFGGATGAVAALGTKAARSIQKEEEEKILKAQRDKQKKKPVPAPQKKAVKKDDINPKKEPPINANPVDVCAPIGKQKIQQQTDSISEAHERLFASMPKMRNWKPFKQYLNIAGLSASHEEQMKASRKIGLTVQKLLNEGISAELKNPNSNRLEVAKKLLKEITKALKNDPIFKDHPTIQQLTEDTIERNPYGVAGAFQSLLLSGAHWFSLQNCGEYNPETGEVKDYCALEFAIISDIQEVTFEDELGSTNAKIAILGTSIHRDRDDMPGLYVPNIQMGIVDGPKIISGEEKRTKSLYDHNLIPATENAATMRKNYLQDTKNHEATHVYIGQKFPRYGKELSSSVAFEVPALHPSQGSKSMGIFGPVQFQELCGVGNELFQSQATTPESLYLYLSGLDNNPTSGYQLVSRLIPGLILDAAPESEQKNTIMEKIRKEGKLKPLDLALLVRDTFSLEHVQLVGATMYSIGHKLFEKAETGTLKRVS